MDDENIRGMLAAGYISEQVSEEAIKRQVQVVASAFELLVVLDPEVALGTLNQLNEQINQESVEEMMEQREAHFLKIKGQVHI